MLVLAVDFGNTTLKAALFDNEELSEVRHSLSEDDLENWIDKLRNNNKTPLEGVIISSVRKNEAMKLSLIEKRKGILDTPNDSKLIIKSNWDTEKIATDSKGIDVIVLDENTPLPIQNKYKTPKTLGKDRLAAVIGAYFLNKEATQQPTLVIDAGTCITFDFIDKHQTNKIEQSMGIYEGGSISLGLKMRFEALNHFTAQLPLFESNKTLPTPIGKTTQEAMQSGVQFGLISEIKGIIDFYQNQITINHQLNKNKKLYPKLNIVICGGDATVLKKWWEEYVISFANTTHIYPKWTIQPNLVLIGLQRIFQFIKKNEDN